MGLRGAEEKEVMEVIQSGQWSPAKRGRYQAKRNFVFGKLSHISQKYYRFKTVEAVFSEEAEKIEVVTVKVYYSNQEVEGGG